MDPNACILRIRRALNGLDLDEVEAAATDLGLWLATGGFAPLNFESIVGFTETDEVVEAIARRIVEANNGPGRPRPMVHDIIGRPERDGRLTCVRLDDRGDLLVYVWGCRTVVDAIEEAQEHAERKGWPIREEDLEVFQVADGDRVLVLARALVAKADHEAALSRQDF